MGWWSRDGKLLLLSRGLRAFGYGYVAVLLGLYLGDSPPRGLGFQPWEVGLFLTVTLASSALISSLAGVWGDRLGRRRVLMASAVGMALAGLLFAVSTNLVVLMVAAVLGTVSPTGGEVGPFLPMEQAILPQVVPAHRRNDSYAIYNLVGSLTAAAGALSAAIPDLLAANGWDERAAIRAMFGLYAVIAVATLAVYLALTKRVEFSAHEREPRPLSPQGRQWILRLSALFALDSFAGGFVITSFVAYWFSIIYGVPKATLAEVFFVVNILTALSFLVAVRLARRIGLLRTMVFTHIPSSIFLIVVPLMPTFALSLAFYLARMSLSQMDVPTRQAYVVAIMSPEDRTAATTFTTIPRNLAQSISPSLSGLLLQSLSASFPFVAGGLLKIAYDLAIFRTFRDIRPPDETAGKSAEAPDTGRGVPSQGESPEE